MAGIGTNPPLIRAADIGVAQCHLDDDRDIALSEAWVLLSVDEATRAQRFHFDRDRTRYVRGRGFLRQMLGQVCRQDPASLIFGTGAQGKPFLAGSNLGSDLAFNLSHSRDLAVLVVSQAGPQGIGPLGIDLEFIDRSADIAGLTQSCMTPPEAAVLAALPADERQARFFAFWTAKEARMKLTGEGMSLPPQQIALDLREGVPVGYLHPETPAVQAIFLDLGNPVAHCCLALAQGPQPTITPLILSTSVIITTPLVPERYYGSL